MGARLLERLAVVKRSFSRVLDLGSGPGYLLRGNMAGTGGLGERADIRELAMCETSHELLWRDAGLDAAVPFKLDRRVCSDGDLCSGLASYPDNHFDLVLTNLALHWVNDLPRAFSEIHRVLKKDGLLLGSMFGGDTLAELRIALQLAETEREGGLAPHVSPFTDFRDIGNILTRAAYNLTMVDVDHLVLWYPDLFRLVRELQGMGENNAVRTRRGYVPRDTIMAAAAIYRELYSGISAVPKLVLPPGQAEPDGEAGAGASAAVPLEPAEPLQLDDPNAVAASFHVIFFTGWKPDESQPKPLERGSAENSLHVFASDSGSK